MKKINNNSKNKNRFEAKREKNKTKWYSIFKRGLFVYFMHVLNIFEPLSF